MNYIKHLTGFFNKSNQDQTITPTHISLYLALFQRWNLNRFKNPIIISREEMMLTAKIKSKATYHKCMRELHEKNYLIYKPSYNPYAGSEVILPDLSILENTQPEFEPSQFNQEYTSLKNEPKKFNKSDTCSNNNNSTLTNEPTNPKNDMKNTSTVPNFEQTKLKNGQVDSQVYINNKTNKNSNKTIGIPTQKKENNKTSSLIKNVPPTLDLVKAYFLEKNISELEAEKFFNYYNSNGWLVGGKTPMKDWQAAIRNWILNLDKFNPKKETNNLNPKNLNVSNSKDYAEPL